MVGARVPRGISSEYIGPVGGDIIICSHSLLFKPFVCYQMKLLEALARGDERDMLADDICEIVELA